jgi:hypothetical protein
LISLLLSPEISYFHILPLLLIHNRCYLISPSLVTPVAVSSPLLTCSVNFWQTSSFIVIRVLSISEFVGLFH